MQVHRYPRLHRSQVSVAVHTMAFQVLLFAMPLSLFIPGCFFSIWNASLIFLSLVCLAWSRMVTSDHLISCGSSLLLSSTCSAHSRLLWVDQSNSVSVLFAAYVECPHGFSNVLLFTSIALDWVHYMCWRSVDRSVEVSVVSIEKQPSEDWCWDW